MTFPIRVRYGIEVEVNSIAELEALATRGETAQSALDSLVEEGQVPTTEGEGDVSSAANPCWVLDREEVVGYSHRTRTYPHFGGKKEICHEEQAIINQIYYDINNNNKSKTIKKVGKWEKISCIPVTNDTPDVNSP